jgi:hypothetical protein
MRAAGSRAESLLSLGFAITVAAALGGARGAHAGIVAQCGEPVCSSSFSIFVEGMYAGGGQLNYDAATGAITLDFDEEDIRGGGMLIRDSANNPTGIMWDAGNGTTVSVDGLSGNADPILGFGVATTTAAVGTTVGFVFNLPIALSGQIQANSQVSYSLTSLSSAGAQIGQIGVDKIVRAFEVDTSVGGIGTVNKGVDVGDTFFVLGGPTATTSGSYSAVNFFTGNLAYDLMRVEINYALSPNSAVGLSGFVQQVVVPLPAALPLLLAGLAGLGAAARRRRAARLG